MSKVQTQTGLRRFFQSGYELPVISTGAVGLPCIREPRMRFALPFLALVALAPPAQAEMPATLLLYPHATVQLEVGGRCAVVTNVSDMLVYVPTAAPAWAAFLKARYAAVTMAGCGR
jgi:hypothetical protein